MRIQVRKTRRPKLSGFRERREEVRVIAEQLRIVVLQCLLLVPTHRVRPLYNPVPRSMPRWHNRTSVRLLFALVVSSFGTLLRAPLAKAQSSATVDPSDPIYRSIDRFISEGLIDTVLVGQRPYSRRQIARLVAQAARNRARLEAGFAGKSLTADSRSALAQRLQYTNALIDQARIVYQVDTVAARPRSDVPFAGRLDRMTLEGAVLRSPTRGVPDGGIPGISAVTNPLVDDRQGRPYVDGVTDAIEGAGHGDLGRFASLNVAGDARGLSSHGTRRQTSRVSVLSLSTRLRNLRVDVGRDYLSWGQAPRGGLAFSLNAPALDMVRITSDAPFVLPWVFRYVGPVGVTVFMADLGKHREFPHAKLVGWKVSAAPVKQLELGLTVIDETGGNGAPPASFASRFEDAFPFVDALFRNKSDFEFSNKLAGADIRLRIPSAGGLELYGETLFDDFDLRRVKSSFWQDNGILAGFSLPRLTTDGVWRLDGEVHHTGLRYYQHGQFSSGITFQDHILGDALGPRGDAAYATLTWAPTVVQEIAVRTAFERRSNDQYVILSDGAPAYRNFRFQKVETLPKETRQRLTLMWSAGSGVLGLRSVVEFGLEHVSHFGFDVNQDGANGLLRVALELRP